MSEIISYVLLVVFAAANVAIGRVVKKTSRLRYQAISSNKTLMNAVLLVGLALMLCIPEKGIAWVLAGTLFFLLIMVLKRLPDGLDEEGVYLTGRKFTYDQFEAYSVRSVDKTTEIRFYRPGSIRMMAFSKNEARKVEQYLSSKGLRKQEFQQMQVNR